ncbi:MAG: MBL fold metallo-hydrolase [Gemmatimonadota bacterium]
MHGDVNPGPDSRAAGEPRAGTRRSDEGARLRATCWGTRGSIPSPGPATALFGGNTPCLEVRSDDGRRYVFDAGTGIRVLGNRLSQENGATELDLFLTHFHWDHIQGIPFFAPLNEANTVVRIHAARQGDLDIETLLRGQMGPVYFPVPYEALAATLSFEHLSGVPWRDGDIEIAAFRVRHPADTYGYRIRAGAAAVAYIPDNELVGARYPVDGPDWYPGLVDFLAGVETLFHDAMFTEDEYPRVEGWGHSTFDQAVRLAEDAGVRRLFFFHHAPERSDAELLRILEGARAEVDRRGSALELGIAAEGQELLVEGRP